MKKRNITILINMSEIMKLDEFEMARRLERIIQNIKICRKANCEIKIASLAMTKKKTINERGRKSFVISLGMSSSQSAKATKF